LNNLDFQYQNLLHDIIQHGVTKQDRTGTGTLSVFGRQIRHRMSDGFPLLTTKKMAWKSIVTELLWFLRGDTNIKYLVDNNCHIWDGDAYKRFLNETIKVEPLEIKQRAIEQLLNSKESKEEFINKIKTDDEFANKWGELGPIYGKQWRSWGRKNVTNYDLKDVKGSDQPKVVEAIKNGEDVSRYGVKIEYQNNSIDQIQNLIDELKTNPDSRRLMVSAWNVGELDKMVLPPCHYGFQVYTRELSLEERTEYKKKRDGIARTFAPYSHQMLDNSNIPKRAISLMWNQRSVDTFLGLPFNIASYGLLLMMIANEVNMIPDELIGNLGDVHLYKNHIEQAKEQISREPFELPSVHIRDGIESFMPGDIVLENYQSHPAIKAPLSN
jgi:thymidylate synthase